MKICVQISIEQVVHYDEVESVIQKAFENAHYTNGKEWLLVKKLRASEHFIPELSLIALYERQIIGHVLLSSIEITDASGRKHSSLALAPLSVLPEFQNKEVGSQLMLAAISSAKSTSFNSIILLGDPDYYSRFGFKPASQWSILPPFEVQDETFMAIELKQGSLATVSGVVVYPPEFDEM